MLPSVIRMPRPSLVVRALVLVPLLAVGVDLARATLACGPRAETCLEAAGQGWLGPAGSVLLVLYALGLALAVNALVRGGSGSVRMPPFLKLWVIGSVAVAAVCGGQALLAGALGGAELGGGWLELVALCFVAGALLAVALRIAPAAQELVRALRPQAPRARSVAPPAHRVAALRAPRPVVRFALVERERGPPPPVA